MVIVSYQYGLDEDKMADEQTPQTAPTLLPRVRDPQYMEIYSNMSTTNMGAFDLTITFQKSAELAPGQFGVIDQVSVTFSPQHFKGLAKSLATTLEAYEASFGALSISDAETTPKKSAAEIIEQVNAARKAAETAERLSKRES